MSEQRSSEFFKRQRDKLVDELMNANRLVGSKSREIRELQREIKDLEEMLVEKTLQLRKFNNLSAPESRNINNLGASELTKELK